MGLPEQSFEDADQQQGEDLGQFVRRLYEKHSEGRRAHSRNVQLSLSMMAGYQWFRADRFRGVIPVENETNEQRITENLMWPTFQWRQEMLNGQRPVPTAIEGALDVADAKAALVAARLMRYWYDKCGLEQAVMRAGAWTDITGMAFMAPVWRNKGTRVVKNRVVLDKAMVKSGPGGIKLHTFIKEETTREANGDMAFDVYSSVQVQCLPDDADCWDKVECLIIGDAVTENFLHRTFKPLKLKVPDNMEPLTNNSFNLEMLRKINAMVSPAVGDNNIDTKSVRYLLLQYRERPCPDYPDGRYIITAGGKVVYNGPLPYIDEIREADPNDAFNLTMGLVPMFSAQFPGKLIPPSPVEAMRGPQIQYNKVLTDQVNNRTTIGRNRILVRKNVIKDDTFTDEANQIIEYEGGPDMKPEIMVGAPLVGIESEIATRKRSFDMLSGRPEVLQGINPPQVRSAWQLSSIKEEAMSPLAQAAYQRERTITFVMQISLAIARHNYTLARLAEIYGNDNIGDVPSFFEANLRTDIVIERGSLLPRNHAEYEQKLIEIYKMGAFAKDNQSVMDNERFLKMIRMGSTNMGLTGVELQKTRIERENATMALGQPLELKLEDDDNLHVKWHLDYMQTREFEEASPTVKDVFRAHVYLHRARLTSIMMGRGTLDTEAPDAMGAEEQPMMEGMG